MSRRPRVYWVFTVMANQDSIEPRDHHWCRRCDARQVIPLPMDSYDYVRYGKAFIYLHSYCLSRPLTESTGTPA